MAKNNIDLAIACISYQVTTLKEKFPFMDWQRNFIVFIPKSLEKLMLDNYDTRLQKQSETLLGMKYIAYYGTYISVGLKEDTSSW